MKLTVSNIAWKQQDTEKALTILNKYQITGIDIAPTLINRDVEKIDTTNLVQYYKSFNLKLVGMQSLLFSCPPVSLFDGETEKNLILEHLIKVYKLAKKLNIKKLVFGSPKNRFIKNKNTFNLETAVLTFKEICDAATPYNCTICLEPNPVEYGCNFISNTFEAIDFIKKVNCINFKLNLDISTTLLNNESLEKIFFEGNDLIEHIHISSPYLKGISLLENKNICSIIKNFNYNKWLALECNFQNNNNLVEFENNIEIFSNEYTM